MLSDLPDYGDLITLIPESGVQLVQLGFNADDLPQKSWPFYVSPDGALIALSPDTSADGDGYTYVDHNGREQRVAEETFQVSLKDIFDLTLGAWVPTPFFREDETGGVVDGPYDWVRARMVDIVETYGESDREGNTHRLTMAFDTGLLPFDETGTYLAPSPKDAKDGKLFSLAHEPERLGNYINQDWVADWIFEIYRDREWERAKREIPEDVIREQMVERYDVDCFDFAVYLALLSLLNAAGGKRRVMLIDTQSEPRKIPIDVDLVLDVGNSRTCGVLIEAGNEDVPGAGLRRATQLELRDLSRPELSYREPFDSRIEFAQAFFGKPHLAVKSGRGSAFVWPTITRVGPEAIWLSGEREGTGGDTGMSSPKRYLWDLAPRVQSWRFNGKSVEGVLEPPAKEGLFVSHVNPSGVPRHRLAPDDPTNIPAVEARYSRSSLMCFALGEVFYQALTMINSPAYRWRRGQQPIPRRLRNIILTMPTALSLPERQRLEERARDAIGILWRTEGRKPDDPDIPNLEVQWDEASATQLVYLYTEIARSFKGDALRFFEIMGRFCKREGGRCNTVRVASIDIGGGTTDLIITDYAAEGEARSVTLAPHQRFREGFNLAGDDILRKVIERHVLTTIEKAMADAEVRNARALMNELFGADREQTDQREGTRRQQFVTQIAIPIGLGLLAAYEEFDPDNPVEREPTAFWDFFEASAKPHDDLIFFVNNRAIERGGIDFDLREVSFALNFGEIAETVRSVIGFTLAALCEAVRAYHCDVLLLSGRPSRLPAVTESINAALPLPPDRVVPLHNYRVGDWYPFRDSDHRISDPKTTAAVGAMIGAIARGRLEFFGFRSELLHPRSTAHYIGLIDDEGHIKDQDLYFREVDLEAEEYQIPDDAIPFRNKMHLGFRQLPLDRWPGTRMYVLDFSRDEAAERWRKQTPLMVKIEKSARAKGSPEDLVIKEVVDKDGTTVPPRDLNLRLQTMKESDGYWIDTGAIR